MLHELVPLFTLNLNVENAQIQHENILKRQTGRVSVLVSLILCISDANGSLFHQYNMSDVHLYTHFMAHYKTYHDFHAKQGDTAITLGCYSQYHCILGLVLQH